MVKFNRQYDLNIQKVDEEHSLTIQNPFTLEFDVMRICLASANFASFSIYNLSLANRNFIRKDRQDFGLYRSILLHAGYGDNKPTIFQGNISHAWSIREGTNFITTMECFDGGFAFENAQAVLPFRVERLR